MLAVRGFVLHSCLYGITLFCQGKKNEVGEAGEQLPSACVYFSHPAHSANIENLATVQLGIFRVR